MTTTKPFQLGSISTGTLNTKDLLEQCFVALRAIDSDNSVLTMKVVGWHAQSILAALLSALNNLCPPFVYFGAHPGGADLGFWPDIDRLIDEIAGGRAEDIENGVDYVMADFSGGSCIVQFANGNPCVMDMDRNILWSTV